MLPAATRLTSTLALALLLWAAPRIDAGVLVLDAANGPGADFTDLPTAVAALGEGDTLLVRDGSYVTGAALTLDGRAMSIVADAGAEVAILGQFVIRNLAVGQNVLLRGLDFESVVLGAALQIHDCEGSVWIEECSVIVSSPIWLQNAMEVVSSARVSVHRSAIGRDIAMNSSGRDGLTSLDSRVFLYDSVLKGGAGGPPGDCANHGGDAASITGGLLFASGTRFSGGDAGPGSFIPLCMSGAGGSGLVLATDQTQAHLLDCIFEGGLPSDGSPGEPIEASPGAIVDLIPGDAPFLDITSPAREGEMVTFTVRGATGDFLFLMLSLSSEAAYLPARQLGLLVGQPLVFLPLIAMPADEIVFDVAIEELGPGIDGGTLYWQAGFEDPGGGFMTSGGSALTLLDAGF